jgi:hypothetical protein
MRFVCVGSDNTRVPIHIRWCVCAYVMGDGQMMIYVVRWVGWWLASFFGTTSSWWKKNENLRGGLVAVGDKTQSRRSP